LTQCKGITKLSLCKSTGMHSQLYNSNCSYLLQNSTIQHLNLLHCGELSLANYCLLAANTSITSFDIDFPLGIAAVNAFAQNTALENLTTTFPAAMPVSVIEELLSIPKLQSLSSKHEFGNMNLPSFTRINNTSLKCLSLYCDLAMLEDILNVCHSIHTVTIQKFELLKLPSFLTRVRNKFPNIRITSYKEKDIIFPTYDHTVKEICMGKKRSVDLMNWHDEGL